MILSSDDLFKIHISRFKNLDLRISIFGMKALDWVGEYLVEILS